MRKTVTTKDVPEEVTSAENFILTEVSEIFHNIASAKDKMLTVNPNLEV